MDDKLLEIPKMPTSRIVRLLGDTHERMTWLYGNNWKQDSRWRGYDPAVAWERIATTVAPIIEALSDVLDRRVPTPYASLQHLIRDPKEVSKPKIHPYTGEYIPSAPELPELPKAPKSVPSGTHEAWNTPIYPGALVECVDVESEVAFSSRYIGMRAIWRGISGYIEEVDLTRSGVFYQLAQIVFDRPNIYSNGEPPRRWVSMREVIFEPAVPA